LLIQCTLLISVLILCWGRWVFDPVAIISFAIFTAGIYALSAYLSIKYRNSLTYLSKKHITKVLLFIVVSLSFFTASFLCKHHWLGIHIYFVPSASMEPTLKPGQFILVDTWIYQDRAPSLNDVVVFEHGVKKQHLVKRISPWPSGEMTKGNAWYVMGDNRAASQDSRYFGGIKTEQLIGEVKLIIFAFNKQYQLLKEPLLMPVQ
jgi:nickel-type superoxide dismutase maturation protease